MTTKTTSASASKAKRTSKPKKAQPTKKVQALDAYLKAQAAAKAASTAKGNALDELLGMPSVKHGQTIQASDGVLYLVVDHVTETEAKAKVLDMFMDECDAKTRKELTGMLADNKGSRKVRDVRKV